MNAKRRYLNLGTYTEIDVPFAEALAETRRIDDLSSGGTRASDALLVFILDLQTYTSCARDAGSC